jgi:hypothetical protein
MASRYLVTGADLGIIKGLIKHDPKDCEKYIEELLDTRYVTTISSNIENDIIDVRKVLEEKT